MIDPNLTYERVIRILKESGAEYLLFEHRPALSYEELAVVQKEAGFTGTEGKCLVMRADDAFLVYVTMQGNWIDFGAVREAAVARKVRLATADELRESFGAEPGCAYPFGFDRSVAIYVDPAVYEQEWLLFSPVLPTRTVQVRAAHLKAVFAGLGNTVVETAAFNKS